MKKAKQKNDSENTIATRLQRKDMIYSYLEVPQQVVRAANNRIKKLFPFWEHSKGSPNFMLTTFFLDLNALDRDT